MSIKKVEIKVDINCEKCKTQVMETVTKLTGVDQVSLDLQKSVLTVVGKMDPVCVAARLEKIKKTPIIVSIGPPKPPEPKPENKPLPPVCTRCDVVSMTTYDSGSACSIL